MAVVHTPLSAIAPGMDAFNIKVQIIRLWKCTGQNASKIPFSLDMVLMDEAGTKIHATVKKTLIYRFEKQLEESSCYTMKGLEVVSEEGHFRPSTHAYKLSFQFSTHVQALRETIELGSPYTFVPFSEIQSPEFNQSYLVDVIGIFTGIGTETEFVHKNQKNKMNVIQLDQHGVKIACALFGSYVDDLNASMASGYGVNSVVVIQLAKANTYKGVVGLKNAMQTTKLLFEPDIPEAAPFRHRLLENSESLPHVLSQVNTQSPPVSPDDDFLRLTAPKKLGELKHISESCNVVVLGTIIDVHPDQDWWYTACKCGRSVFPDSGRYFCEACNHHVVDVYPRYRIKVRVDDETDSATFVIFEREATKLLVKSCQQMIENINKANNSSEFPEEILSLVDKIFLFKVEVKTVINSRFEPSFPVKRLSADPILIQKFIDSNKSKVSESTPSYGGKDEMSTFGEKSNKNDSTSDLLQAQQLPKKTLTSDLIKVIKKEKDENRIDRATSSKRLSDLDVMDLSTQNSTKKVGRAV